MSETIPMRDQILSAAEKRVRAVGFNAVSFRDVASDVGIKSSSIHYHFPQKEDLGVHLVTGYRERFQARLQMIDRRSPSPREAIQAFILLYDEALVIGSSVCLCAILSAEANSLPERVATGIRDFFTVNVDWLCKVHDRMDSTAGLFAPLEIIAALEGAMIVSSAMKTREAFDAAAKRILATYI